MRRLTIRDIAKLPVIIVTRAPVFFVLIAFIKMGDWANSLCEYLDNKLPGIKR